MGSELDQFEEDEAVEGEVVGMQRLRLEIDSGTIENDYGNFSRVHFYESSVVHAETGDPLVSIITSGDGMRLTPSQVVELRDWLSQWLENHKMPR
jgi:hypothetical protein